MYKIRFGKDIEFRWTITTNGENTSLEGRDLKVVICAANNGKQYVPRFVCEGNVVSFVFYGKDHFAYGVYHVTLWENYGKVGQTVVDKMDAFVLVHNTDLENS